MDKPRSAAVATLLSLAMPGLGHLYGGRLGLALLFWPLAFVNWAYFLTIWNLGCAGLTTGLSVFSGLTAATWITAAVHAGLTARRVAPDYRLRTYNLWYFYLLVWLLGSALPNWGLVRLTRAHLLQTLPVHTDHLQPTLIEGDWVMVDKRTCTVEDLGPGALVAARDPGDGVTVRFLRIAGIEGDRVEIPPGGPSLGSLHRSHLLGRVLLVRWSKDPRSGKFLKERRRLEVR